MTAPTQFALADALSLVLPHVPDNLHAPHTRTQLLRLAERLPPLARVLLECRLAEAGQVDLSLCITDSEVDRTLLPRYFLGGELPEWDRVAAFVKWWCEENDCDGRLTSAWFEFDVDREYGSLPLPSIFLHLKSSRVNPCTAQSTGVAAALECLQPGAATSLDKWLQTLPGEAVPTYVGVMLSRSSKALRLNVAGLSPESAWSWLSTYGAPDPQFRMLFEETYRLGGKTILAVDVDEVVGTRIGLECRPANEADSRAMFEILADSGLCSDATYESLDTWPGYLSAMEKGADWPLYLALEALVRSNMGASLLLRQFNHLKLVYDENGLTDAKIYLALNHVVYSSDEERSGEDDGELRANRKVVTGGLFTGEDVRFRSAAPPPETAADLKDPTG